MPGRIIRCAVPTCKNCKYFKQPVERADLLFFNFPRGREVKWAEMIGRLDIINDTNFSGRRVCSDHFKKEDYEPNVATTIFNLDNRPKLRPDVIPSLLLPGPGEIQRSELARKKKFKRKAFVNRPLEDTVPPEGDLVDEGGEDEARLLAEEEEKQANGVKEECLICSEMTDCSLPKYKFEGSADVGQLNEQLWATFVLRRIVELPVWKFEEFLTAAGTSVHPGQWFVVCGTCSQGLVEIMTIQEQIRRLQENIDKLRESLQRKFRNNLEMTHISVNNLKESQVWNASQAIRTCLKKWADEVKEENMPDKNIEIVSIPQELPEDEEIDQDEEWTPPSEASGSERSLSLEQFNEDMLETPQMAREFNSVATSETTSDDADDCNDERYFTCTLCHRKYSSESLLKSHLKLHRRTKMVENGRYDCGQCGLPFNNVVGIKNHLRKKHRLYLHPKWEKSGEPQTDFLYSHKTEKAVHARIKERMKGCGDDDYEVRKSRPTGGHSLVRYGSYPCKICPGMFKLKGYLQKHMEYHELTRSQHNGRYDCSRCKKPFTHFRNLRIHYRSKHNQNLNQLWEDENGMSQDDYLADLPGTKTKPSKNVTAAVTDKDVDAESGEKFQCSECTLSCNSRPGLKSHMSKRHGKRWDNDVCDICGFEAPNQKMKQHSFHHKMFDNSIDPSISTTEFTCNLCKQQAKTRRLLINHKVNFHAEELQLEVYRCSECPQAFIRKDNWMSHEMRIHKKTGKYSCDKCSQQFVTRTEVENHKVKHTDSAFICQYCSASYTYNQGLQQHIRRYHPEKYVAADWNYFVGVQVETLSTEGDQPSWNFKMREQQKKQKQVSCKYCDAVLPHKLAFNLHLKETHKDMYSFQCDLCDKVYMSHTSLQLHKKVNHQEKDKRAKCAWCLKPVSHRLYLYSHAKVCPKKPKNAPKIMAIDEEETVVSGDCILGTTETNTHVNTQNH